VIRISNKQDIEKILLIYWYLKKKGKNVVMFRQDGEKWINEGGKYRLEEFVQIQNHTATPSNTQQSEKQLLDHLRVCNFMEFADNIILSEHLTANLPELFEIMDNLSGRKCFLNKVNVWSSPNDNSFANGSEEEADRHWFSIYEFQSIGAILCAFLEYSIMEKFEEQKAKKRVPEQYEPEYFHFRESLLREIKEFPAVMEECANLVNMKIKEQIQWLDEDNNNLPIKTGGRDRYLFSLIYRNHYNPEFAGYKQKENLMEQIQVYLKREDKKEIMAMVLHPEFTCFGNIMNFIFHSIYKDWTAQITNIKIDLFNLTLEEENPAAKKSSKKKKKKARRKKKADEANEKKEEEEVSEAEDDQKKKTLGDEDTKNTPNLTKETDSDNNKHIYLQEQVEEEKKEGAVLIDTKAVQDKINKKSKAESKKEKKNAKRKQRTVATSQIKEEEGGSQKMMSEFGIEKASYLSVAGSETNKAPCSHAFMGCTTDKIDRFLPLRKKSFFEKEATTEKCPSLTDGEKGGMRPNRCLSSEHKDKGRNYHLEEIRSDTKQRFDKLQTKTETERSPERTETVDKSEKMDERSVGYSEENLEIEESWSKENKYQGSGKKIKNSYPEEDNYNEEEEEQIYEKVSEKEKSTEANYQGEEKKEKKKPRLTKMSIPSKNDNRNGRGGMKKYERPKRQEFTEKYTPVKRDEGKGFKPSERPSTIYMKKTDSYQGSSKQETGGSGKVYEIKKTEKWANETSIGKTNSYSSTNNSDSRYKQADYTRVEAPKGKPVADKGDSKGSREGEQKTGKEHSQGGEPTQMVTERFVIENTMDPLSFLNTEANRLIKQLTDYAEKTEDMRQIAKGRIDVLMKITFNGSKDLVLKSYGSSESRLIIPNSDIDLLISTPEVDNKDISIKMLDCLKENLEATPWVVNIVLIKNATIPVLKVEMDAGIPFDFKSIDKAYLSEQFVKSTNKLVSNDPQKKFIQKIDIIVETPEITSLMTTEYTKKSIKTYPDVFKLALLVKLFLYEKDLTNSYKGKQNLTSGGLSGYAITLLVVAWVEYSKTQNKSYEGNLYLNFRDMVEFYGCEFAPSKQIICTCYGFK
jgi:hypothetical protein